jgi:hypothetical protein
MNPNSSDPSNTPPADDVTPETPLNPEATETPVTPETPAQAPVEAPAPEVTAEPVAPAPAPEVASPFTAGTPEGIDPVAPVGTTATFTASGAPEAPKKNSKKIVLIASIVGGAILLAVIGVVVFLLLTTVSKDDYRAAAKQFNEVSKASSSLNSDVSSLGRATGSTPDATFDENVKETEESLAALKSTNDELGKLKAVRVGEGATLYKAFNDKLAAYTAYGSDMVASVKALRPALVICDKSGDAGDAAARVAALKDCSDALGKVNDLPNAEFKAFVAELKDAYAKIATLSESMSGITDPYGKQYEEYKKIRDDLTAVSTKLSAATRTFSTAVKEHDDQVSVKDAAEALADYLNEQQK